LQAISTSPGVDGLEYRHLRALDPDCILLETVCRIVSKIGIPNCWKISLTVPIFKKGDTSDYSNFRPISLLPTIYKLFSGVISQRLTEVSSDLGWLSPEQKGFLPGVHGIQENPQLLQTVVEETRTKRRQVSIAWLDMCKRLVLCLTPFLESCLLLFRYQTTSGASWRTFTRGIGWILPYRKNLFEFSPTAGVRQGDALSAHIFNLASKPLTTAYADDIAVVTYSPYELQNILNIFSLSTDTLGLQFNAGKCVFLVIDKGLPSESLCRIGTKPIRCLGPDDQQTYSTHARYGITSVQKRRFNPREMGVR
ncbi:Uncharacterized protein APZ42_005373, partial [Daphnia magna]